MILVKDQIEYTNPDGEKLIGQVVNKSEQDVLECNLLYPTKTKQPGEKFFVNADDKMVKKAEIKRQPYDKHKSQYSFNKESMEIIKEEENILKLGLKKLASLDKKYSEKEKFKLEWVGEWPYRKTVAENIGTLVSGSLVNRSIVLSMGDTQEEYEYRRPAASRYWFEINNSQEPLKITPIT